MRLSVRRTDQSPLLQRCLSAEREQVLRRPERFQRDPMPSVWIIPGQTSGPTVAMGNFASPKKHRPRRKLIDWIVELAPRPDACAARDRFSSNHLGKFLNPSYVVVDVDYACCVQEHQMSSRWHADRGNGN